MIRPPRGARRLRPVSMPIGRSHLLHALRPRRTLRGGLIQLIYAAGGVGFGLLVPHLHWGATVNSHDAVTLLSGAAAALLTVGSVVYALLFLVVQFAANAQSPRLNYFRDAPLVGHTLGLVL